MGVYLKLPRGIGLITSQAEPGTDTKDYIDERFAAPYSILLRKDGSLHSRQKNAEEEQISKTCKI